MELEKVPAPDGLSVYGGPAELPVSPEDAEWALAEGREKVLRNVGEVLLRVLEPGERVRLVSKAFASRKWALPQNSWRRAFDRLTLIATDRRVLLIHVDRKGRPSLYAQQISFTSIRRAHPRLFGFGLLIETGDGVINIHGMRRKTQDRLVDLVDRNPNAALGWQPLCPSCLKAQESTTGPCTVCGAECKSARTAALSEDIELEDAHDFFHWGDRSMHVFLTSGGETFGQIFMAQQGRIVFSVTISGVYFDQPGDFEEFLLPYLEQIAQLANQPHQRPKS